ncbi:hypothetical protein [Dactylosporangium darangshiense]|uniref:hypothetical protein n=1 Tax=Dactylosporangium darangshiense TaxID=579108 RepID=UPI0031EB84C8
MVAGAEHPGGDGHHLRVRGAEDLFEVRPHGHRALPHFIQHTLAAPPVPRM